MLLIPESFPLHDKANGIYCAIESLSPSSTIIFFVTAPVAIYSVAWLDF